MCCYIIIQLSFLHINTRCKEFCQLTYATCLRLIIRTITVVLFTMSSNKLIDLMLKFVFFSDVKPWLEASSCRLWSWLWYLWSWPFYSGICLVLGLVNLTRLTAWIWSWLTIFGTACCTERVWGTLCMLASSAPVERVFSRSPHYFSCF